MLRRLWRFLFGRPLACEAAHELRSSLGAIKNALYYVKEFIKENRLEEKDPAILEVLGHADREVQKAAELIGDWQEEEISKNGPGNFA